MDSEVIIVGAGPVGLTLAIDLGLRGISTVLLERKPGPIRLPKMERTNPRSMEIFRRLGVADQIRARGLAPDKSMDIFMVASLASPPLVRIPYPNVNAARALCEASADGTQPREPWQLISQYTLEPILIEKAQSLASVRILFETELESLEQDEGQVRARARGADGEPLEIAARFLVGCDGANSRVRELAGIEMEGRADLGTLMNIFFRCDDLLEKHGVPQGRHWQFVNETANGGAGGSIVMQDDMKHFAYHSAALPDGDLVAFLQELTGLPIEPEILHTGQWTQNMMVAKRHRDRRVFLAGDSNHIYIPAGGLGMNTGVVDAINLGWKLDAVIRDWGGPGLLESYAAERGAVARRTLGFVAFAVEGAVRMRDGFEPGMLDGTPEAKAALDGYLATAVPLLRRVYDMHGADRGYRYASDVIAQEDGPPPPDDAYVFVPSTYPGSHLPNMWLSPSVSVYDRLGAGYSLIRIGAVDSTALEAAFARHGAPLTVVSLEDPRFLDVYEQTLLLVRPDVHVAWRGAEAPDDPVSLAGKLLGLESKHAPDPGTRRFATAAAE